MNAPAAYIPRATGRDKRIDPPRAYGRYAMAVRLRDAVVRAVSDAASAAVRNEETKRQRDTGGPRVVDFGCGDMPYRPLLQNVVGAYEGVDLPGNAAARWHLRDDGTCDAPGACADLVLSTQVLEHVRDVGAYLRECRRLLAPGGRLLLTTHGTWVYHADPHDYWRWTPEGLTAALADAGLEVERLDGLLGLMPLGVQLFQDGLVRKLPRWKWLRSGACLVLQQLILLLDRLHTDDDRRKDACVYVIVARVAGGEPAPSSTKVRRGASGMSP